MENKEVYVLMHNDGWRCDCLELYSSLEKAKERVDELWNRFLVRHTDNDEDFWKNNDRDYIRFKKISEDEFNMRYYLYNRDGYMSVCRDIKKEVSYGREAGCLGDEEAIMKADFIFEDTDYRYSSPKEYKFHEWVYIHKREVLL